MTLAWVVAVVVVGQVQRPAPPGSPEGLVLSSAKWSVRVADSIDPDRLRNLARPRVSLWLRTSSNTLRASTLEHLGRFDEAWVQLRAPLSPLDAAQLQALPRVGLWVGPDDVEAVRARLPGRRLAVQLRGPLDDAQLGRLARARPAVALWDPDGPVDLLTWAAFRALPGRKVWVAGPSGLSPARCGARQAQEPAVELHVATLLSLNAEVFPCGLGPRVVVPPTVDQWLVQSLVVREPSVELVLELGADDEAASQARRLLEGVGVGPAR